MQNPSSLPEKEQPFFIKGPIGPLEMLVLKAPHQTQDVAVICHPHPLHEGTMHNKVVHTLSRAFHHRGLHALRFNFRGVGQSHGCFGNSIGELADLLAVIDWVKTAVDSPRFWLAGFSFGAYIAAKGASMINCQQLFSIAPAVHHQPYAELDTIACPWIVIQGEKDEVVPPELVYQMVEAQRLRQPKISLYKMSDATHFFHGKLVILRNMIETLFISNQ